MHKFINNPDNLTEELLEGYGVLNSDRHLEPPEPKNPRIGLAFARYEEIMEERAALDEERLSIREWLNDQGYYTEDQLYGRG